MPIKYVFCINAGRSGSNYLANVFRRGGNTVSRHEPWPSCFGPDMAAFNDGDDRPMRARCAEKVSEIGRLTGGTDRVYVETNHAFIKGAGYVLAEMLPADEVAVLICRRSPEKTAESLLQCRTVPGANELSRYFYLAPGARRNVLAAPQGAPADNPLAFCRWYVDEIAARARDFQTRFPGIAYHDFTLEQANDPQFVAELFEALGVEPGTAFGPDSPIGRAANAVRGDTSHAVQQPIAELAALPDLPSLDSLAGAARNAVLAGMFERFANGPARDELWRTLNSEHAVCGPHDEHGAMDKKLVHLIKLMSHHSAGLEAEFGFRIRFTEAEWEFIKMLGHLLRTGAGTDRAGALAVHGVAGWTKTFEWGSTPELLREVFSPVQRPDQGYGVAVGTG